MGLNGWRRTGARMTICRHGVKLERGARSEDSSSRSSRRITIDWPAVLWAFAWVAETPGARQEWHWIIRDNKGKRLHEGMTTSEAGARSAVMRRVKGIVAETRKLPEVLKLEAERLAPLIAEGYASQGQEV